jgi:hypothetical protein
MRAILVVEGVHAVDADEQHMLDVVVSPVVIFSVTGYRGDSQRGGASQQ